MGSGVFPGRAGGLSLARIYNHWKCVIRTACIFQGISSQYYCCGTTRRPTSISYDAERVHILRFAETQGLDSFRPVERVTAAMVLR